MVVVVVVLIEKICQGLDGYLGGTVGIIGVGGLVAKFQLFVVTTAGHRSGVCGGCGCGGGCHIGGGLVSGRGSGMGRVGGTV